MKKILICLLFISTIYSKKNSMTSSFTYKILLDNIEVNMILDSTDSRIVLYNNSMAPYTPFIELNDKNQDMSNIVLNGLPIPEFPIEVLNEDSYDFSSTTAQGKIGMGINKDTVSNVLMNELYKNGLIFRKLIYFDINKDDNSLSLLVDKSKEDIANITRCKLTQKGELEDKYQNGWVCDFSHIVLNNKTKEENKGVSWDDNIDINGRVIFDTNINYIKAPVDYIDYIMLFFNFKENVCSKVPTENYETFLSCAFDSKKDIEKLNDFYFLFDGFGYLIPNEDLFEKTENGYLCKIIFTEEINNIWSFGYPFLKNYMIEFDFDNKTVGFKGDTNNVVNFTKEWKVWQDESMSFIDKVYNDKTLMIIGIVFGSLILIIIFIIIIRTFIRRNNPPLHSELVEERNKKNEMNNM